MNHTMAAQQESPKKSLMDHAVAVVTHPLFLGIGFGLLVNGGMAFAAPAASPFDAMVTNICTNVITPLKGPVAGLVFVGSMVAGGLMIQQGNDRGKTMILGGVAGAVVIAVGPGLASSLITGAGAC